ncbi:hypothetical protein [Streptomyces sp. NPDC059466]|uniref:hypothetical protein n=1 Tax=unclassified Streptomyces TaxID=2593676 RepID=UPI00367A1878
MHTTRRQPSNGVPTHRQHADGVPTPRDRWLVGLRLQTPQTAHTPQTAATWHYYVIDETTEPVDAVATAIRRATTPHSPTPDRAVRIADLEIRRLRRGLLGEMSLDPGTRLDVDHLPPVGDL